MSLADSVLIMRLCDTDDLSGRDPWMSRLSKFAIIFFIAGPRKVIRETSQSRNSILLGSMG
ncbi:hypothetical protein BMW22_36800 (plasmid) [Rhizobium leguminosarum]|uniref:Uncharacterized protein n=1 Tax=Rhizobium leguminosarum TaxID=384 RepID=A0A1L3ZN52_RHILE|nr:hypothetical protein BMW22_36800 [Rhizobium leguminosarum]NKQ89172.1 hypothetical protein [Rhizobium ruizarguesonis]